MSNGCTASAFLPAFLDTVDKGVAGVDVGNDVGGRTAAGVGVVRDAVVVDVARDAVDDLLRDREGSGSLRSISMSTVRSNTCLSLGFASCFSGTWCRVLG